MDTQEQAFIIAAALKYAETEAKKAEALRDGKTVQKHGKLRKGAR